MPLQKLESPHGVLLTTGPCWHPKATSHVSMVQGFGSLQLSGAPCTQLPFTQDSVPLQTSPSWHCRFVVQDTASASDPTSSGNAMTMATMSVRMTLLRRSPPGPPRSWGSRRHARRASLGPAFCEAPSRQRRQALACAHDRCDQRTAPPPGSEASCSDGSRAAEATRRYAMRPGRSSFERRSIEDEFTPPEHVVCVRRSTERDGFDPSAPHHF